MRFSGLDRLSQRFGVHERVHEQFAGIEVGSDGRDKAVGIEFRRELGTFFDLFHGPARCEFLAHFRVAHAREAEIIC